MVRDSNSGHQLLLPPAKCCPILAPWTTQLKPDSRFYNSLIQLCAKAAGGPDLQSALAAVDMMAADGVPPPPPPPPPPTPRTARVS